ncbi:unnamed protein product [Notodromas monacha]|uniref:Uncharacterized protein n=1 Tax=Notodromas monacha TaxID=399045 RepID=A0A7R9BI84_9CRUS|nr:unnamed protein product [Notodromas monacha]CAG0915979.1 unnamed protein product [Notodromas monacha]
MHMCIPAFHPDPLVKNSHTQYSQGILSPAFHPDPLVKNSHTQYSQGILSPGIAPGLGGRPKRHIQQPRRVAECKISSGQETSGDSDFSESQDEPWNPAVQVGVRRKSSSPYYPAIAANAPESGSGDQQYSMNESYESPANEAAVRLLASLEATNSIGIIDNAHQSSNIEGIEERLLSAFRSMNQQMIEEMRSQAAEQRAAVLEIQRSAAKQEKVNKEILDKLERVENFLEELGIPLETLLQGGPSTLTDSNKGYEFDSRLVIPVKKRSELVEVDALLLDKTIRKDLPLNKLPGFYALIENFAALHLNDDDMPKLRTFINKVLRELRNAERKTRKEALGLKERSIDGEDSTQLTNNFAANYESAKSLKELKNVFIGNSKEQSELESDLEEVYAKIGDDKDRHCS